MFYFDPTYIIIMPALIFSMWASARVNATFSKYSNVWAKNGITAAEAAEKVLYASGVYDVRIDHVHGNLTDHYDPRDNTIYLSDNVYSSKSTAAIGVACHEAGHAIQHAEAYVPIRIRQAIVPVTNFGSKFGLLMFIIGIFLGYIATEFIVVAWIGIGLFSLTAVFQVVTLPTEYNASSRALKAIADNNILTRDEIPHAKKVLSAAALTYVAALTVTVLQVFRLLLILGNSRRRD